MTRGVADDEALDVEARQSSELCTSRALTGVVGGLLTVLGVLGFGSFMSAVKYHLKRAQQSCCLLYACCLFCLGPCGINRHARARGETPGSDALITEMSASPRAPS